MKTLRDPDAANSGEKLVKDGGLVFRARVEAQNIWAFSSHTKTFFTRHPRRSISSLAHRHDPEDDSSQLHTTRGLQASAASIGTPRPPFPVLSAQGFVATDTAVRHRYVLQSRPTNGATSVLCARWDPCFGRCTRALSGTIPRCSLYATCSGSWV